MKNLFIMHTQYNLILSAGIASRYKDSENVLVLYAEFQVGQEILESLSETFDRVIVANDSFSPKKSALGEVRFIRQCLKKTKQIRNEKFDNIFMSQERIFDMILCRRAKKINPNAVCYNVEEDAYYSLNEKYNADDFVLTITPRLRRHNRLMAMCLLGYPYNYKDLHYCYGMSSEYHGVNMLFPQLARKELAGKEKIEVTKEEILTGINRLYSRRVTRYPEADSYMVMFFDLMSRYRNRELVLNIVNRVLEDCRNNGIQVLMKYHPRETEKFPAFDGVYEVDQNIPGEKVLADLNGKRVTIFGNATTSCIVAAKLGYKVISISKLEIPNNKKMHSTMESMGINCIEKIEDININV